jgi:hypothetical protein
VFFFVRGTIPPTTICFASLHFGVHLTKDGTSLLINNINDKVGILKHKNDQNETPQNGAPKGNKNVHALTEERAIIHKINVDLMLDFNVINGSI